MVGVTSVRPAPSSGSTRGDAAGSVDEDCATRAPALVSERWLSYPPHLFPCLRFLVHLAMPYAKLGAEWIASPFS